MSFAHHYKDLAVGEKYLDISSSTLAMVILYAAHYVQCSENRLNKLG